MKMPPAFSSFMRVALKGIMLFFFLYPHTPVRLRSSEPIGRFLCSKAGSE